MLRRYRFVLRPGWVVLHVVTVALVVTMTLLGRWQLHVSEAKGFSLQNFGYSLQWWAFAAFAAVLWARLVRDAARRTRSDSTRPAAGADAPAEPASTPDHAVAYRRYVMPSVPVSDDPLHVAYNDYLASLAAEDAKDAS